MLIILEVKTLLIIYEKKSKKTYWLFYFYFSKLCFLIDCNRTLDNQNVETSINIIVIDD